MVQERRASGFSSRASRALDAAATTTTSQSVTTGEIFDNGEIIELVSGAPGANTPNLLLWNGKKAKIGPSIKHGDRTYKGPELPPSLRLAMRLPSRCSSYGSARDLFDGIRDLFKEYLNLPERESGLMACFSISTWLANCLPIAPWLLISGPDQGLGIDVLRLLSCICRHPLILADVTPASFRLLPTQLQLTLLLNLPAWKPNMQRLLRLSSYRGLHVAGKNGSVVDLYGPKAIVCENDSGNAIAGDGAIHLSVTPSMRTVALDERIQNEIANDFQPRLLMYRLKHAGTVCESRVDVSKFTFATRQLARTLAACFPEDSKLAHGAARLLQPQDDEVRGQRSCDVNCAIVEILWRIVHHRKEREIKVGDLTKDVNALLRSRGETLMYSAEDIGWKLKNLNIPKHTSNSGRQVLLGRENSRSIHRLAKGYDLLCSHQIEDDCADCDEHEVTDSTILM